MNNKEIIEAGNKFMDYLEANGVSKIYIALSFLESDKRTHVTYASGINSMEALGISQIFAHDSVRLSRLDQSGINPDSPPAA